jgi:hypothetical protein
VNPYHLGPRGFIAVFTTKTYEDKVPIKIGFVDFYIKLGRFEGKRPQNYLIVPYEPSYDFVCVPLLPSRGAFHRA